MKKISQSISTLWQKYFVGSSSPSQIFLGLQGKDVLELPKNPDETKSLSVSLYVGHSRVVKNVELPVTKELLNIIRQLSTLLEGRNSRAARKAKSTESEQTSSKQTDGSSASSSKLAQRLDNTLNELLKHDEFMEVRDEIRGRLSSDNLLENNLHPEIYIQYEDPDIAQIPLHRWKVLDSLEVEPVFSKFDVKPCDHSYINRKKPRILIILGNAYNHGEDNLDLQADIELWKGDSLPNVEIITITPLNYGDIGSQLWEQDWDILYFAGHSDEVNGETLIELNNEFKVSFSQLQESIQTAVKNGLKLAIFNSCISLGAAADLHKAGVPAVVAMRYPIPDVVAHKFLKFFLQEHLNRGRSVSDSVKQVRKRLYEIEKQGDETFKFASWLPVVFQIPIIAKPAKPSLLIAIATSFFVTCLVFFLHTQGIFQGAELSLYDHMMNSRPAEPLDSRIAIIKIDKDDIDWQKSRGAKLDGYESIDNNHLEKLLEKLDQSKAQVIGLGLTRKEVKSNSIDSRMLNDKSPVLVAICTVESLNEKEYFPDAMINRIPKYRWGDSRIGFTNLMTDTKFNNSLRRLLILQNQPSDRCGDKTQFSFPLRIILNYLGIGESDLTEPELSGGNVMLKYKDIQIANIVNGQGGYQIDPSYPDVLPNRLSILFNYKNHTDKSPDTRQHYSLRDILSKEISLENKIILIGGIQEEITFNSSKDSIQKIDILYIHAQAVDYLLRIFDKKLILRGIERSWYFLVCIICLTCSSICLQLLINKFEYDFFWIYLCKIAFDTGIVYFIHFCMIQAISLWIPSIPILLGITISSIIISLLNQRSKTGIMHIQSF